MKTVAVTGFEKALVGWNGLTRGLRRGSQVGIMEGERKGSGAESYLRLSVLIMDMSLTGQPV